MRMRLLFFMLMIFSGIIFFLMPSDSNGFYYKESDFYKYYKYTDVDIRNAPRISPDYFFYYVPPNGGQREMSAITFTGGEQKRLQKYLQAMGFKLYRIQSNGQEEIWISQNTSDLFSVWRDKGNVISLTKTII